MAVKGFRQSGEFRESKGFGPAGAGLRDEKQRRSTRQDAVDLANNMDTSKYVGDTRDAIQRANIAIKENEARVAQRLAEDPTRAGFRGFLPSRTDIDAFKGSFGRGLDALRSTFTPGRMIASGIGSALFGPIGGFVAGLLANRATTDAFRQDVGNFIGNRVPNFGELNTTTQIGDTFTMPAPSGLLGTTVFGTMPRVTAAPIDTVSEEINAVDLFGNPITTGVDTFDPVVETQPIDSVLDVLTRDLPVMDDQGLFMSMEDMQKDLDRIRSQPQAVFNTPVIDAPMGVAPVDPFNPEMGIIMNDPSLMAPNDVAIDPVTGSLVPVTNLDLSPGFNI